MTFRGFPPEMIHFYEQLGADNSKSFWQAHRDDFQHYVRAPLDDLLAELDEFGPFHVFRPHNDLRFSKNKPPYKTHQGAYGEAEGGSGYYLQVSAEGLMAAAGYYAMAPDQLRRFRAAVDADATGEEVASLVADLQRRRYSIGAISEVKTAPRGYPTDHPRIELLRRKGLMAWKEFGTPKWLHSAGAATKVREAWTGAADLCAWLDAHVGPSTEPPGDRPF